MEAQLSKKRLLTHPPDERSHKRWSGYEEGAGSVTKAAIIGWVIQSAGVAVCLYGYFSTGNPSIVDWHAITPSWIADWLPNIQSEI